MGDKANRVCRICQLGTTGKWNYFDLWTVAGCEGLKTSKSPCSVYEEYHLNGLLVLSVCGE